MNDLDAIRERHVPAAWVDGPDRCLHCLQAWPCDTSVALDALASLREHTLDSNPALRALHEQAVLYRDAVQAWGDVHGPLSTTLEWVIRHGSLSTPAGPGGADPKETRE